MPILRYIPFWLALLGSLPARTAEAQRPLSSVIDSVSPQMVVEQWSMPQGLPQSSVRSLALDASGHVWGATFGGMFRFDGRAIRAYPIRPLDGEVVSALAPSKDGTLYVGTAQGRFAVIGRDLQISPFPAPPFTSGRGIDDIHVDNKGTLWARAWDEIAVFRGGAWKREPGSHYAGSPLVDLPSGEVAYYGSYGYAHGRPGSVRLDSSVPVRPLSDQRQGLYADPLNRIWLGGYDLTVLEGGQAYRIPGVRGIVTTIVPDLKGNVWIGTEVGLYRVARATAPSAALRAEMILGLQVAVLTVTKTKDDLLVVGTRGGGLLVVRERPVRVVPHQVAGDHQVTTVLADPNGNVWAAAGCSDLFLLNRGGQLVDTIPRRQASGCSRAAVRDARNRIWMGMDGVIRRRDHERRFRDWEVPRIDREVISVRPFLLVGDTVLAGLSDGRIARIGPDDQLQFAVGWDQPTGMSIESLERASNGTIWVGQMGRITAWRGASRRVFGATAGMPASVPRALHADRGGVWIGTYGSGLLYLPSDDASGRIRRLPLRDQTVSGFVRDSINRLWMTGNLGLTIVSHAALRRWVGDSLARPDFVLLGMSDGVPEGNYGQPAVIRVGPREIVAASIEGLVRADAAIDRLGQTPPLLIDEIRTAARMLTPERGPMALPAGERNVTVTFSMATYRFADEAQFRYRVVGRDPAWISIDDVRQLQLSGLGAGLHEVRLEGRVPGGTWRAAAPIRLTVAPFWHERWSIRLLLIGVLIGAGAAISRQRWRAVRAEVRAREVELGARRDAAEQAARHQRELAQVGRVAVAGELTASLSHELGQPLAAIVNNAEVARRLALRLQEQTGRDEPVLDEVLRDVVIQGHRASQVVREFRRFLRREPIEPEALSVQELVESVVVLVRQEFAAARVPLRVEVPAPLPRLFGERILLQQVLVNLLQNALEAARLPGRSDAEVLVRLRAANEGVRFTVVDTGPGFSATIRATAFEPFVTGRRHGMGMGLAIARRIVEAHGGTIRLGRLPTAGAVVSVWLPITAPVEGEPGDRLVPAQVTPPVNPAVHTGVSLPGASAPRAVTTS